MSSLTSSCPSLDVSSRPPRAARAPRGPSAGTSCAEHYQLDRLMAWGGMGLVYQATHLVLGTRVAVKVLRPEFGDCDERVAAFLAEAHWLAALSSDHIVRILDAGQLETGLPFFAMELLQGRDLRCVLGACGRLAPSVAVQYALEACCALAEVHDLGLIHCDVKPSNLFLAASRSAAARIKLLDFGIARRARGGLDDDPWSSTDLVVGSPLYCSPEQLQGATRLDGRTDIWSLGLVLFEMLTGICPFAASTIAETQSRVLREQTPRLRDVRPDISPGLASAVETCLQKDPARRFSSIPELARALRPFSP